MTPFKFNCRAVNVEHSCRYKNENEPNHQPELLRCIERIVEATQGMPYNGIIKSSANSYQIDFDFDSSWIKVVNDADWKSKTLNNLQDLRGIPNIKPDTLLFKDDITVTVEIEKSNKKTIWFDIIKIMMLIGQGLSKYGVLVTPRNYAHKIGVWDLFNEARYYKWCFVQYAKVEHNLLSKIAIIGYTQEAKIDGNWKQLDSSIVKSIKEKARQHFS